MVDDPIRFRQHKKEMLFALFKEDVDPIKVPKSLNLMCDNLERGIYNYALKKATELSIVKSWDDSMFVEVYVERLRTIYINLETEAQLRQRFLQKTQPAHEFAFMTHQEMCPDHWAKRIADKKVRDEFKYTPQQEASTDQFTCRKCKSKQCTYYQLQTRSADEPMTTFVTCISCGSRWRC